MSGKTLRADLSLLFVAVIWGGTFVLVKEAVMEVPVYSFIFMRFFLAGLLLFFIALLRRSPLTHRVLKDGIILGIFLFGVFAFQTWGLTTTPASVTAFLTGLYVLFVPLLGFMISREFPTPALGSGIVLAVTGLALLTLQGRILLERGEVFVLICALFCAFHILATPRFARRNDLVLLTTIQILTVALLSLLFSLLTGVRLIPAAFSSTLITALIVTALFATVAAFFIQTAMQRFTTAARTAVVFTAEPLSAAFFALLFGEKALSFRQYIGAFLIVVAMVVVEASRERS